MKTITKRKYKLSKGEKLWLKYISTKENSNKPIVEVMKGTPKKILLKIKSQFEKELKKGFHDKSDIYDIINIRLKRINGALWDDQK